MRNRFLLAAGGVLACAVLPACTTYEYAKDVKMVSFDHDVSPGKGVGPVRGESCQEMILGFPTGDPPTLDQAMADARAQHQVRYINDVATEHTDLEVVLYARRCIIVKGAGYQ
jgi:hypothetical protein